MIMDGMSFPVRVLRKLTSVRLLNSGVALLIAAGWRNSTYADTQRKWLIGLGSFIDLIKHRQK
jgi:hypothetical protein